MKQNKTISTNTRSITYIHDQERIFNGNKIVYIYTIPTIKCVFNFYQNAKTSTGTLKLITKELPKTLVVNIGTSGEDIDITQDRPEYTAILNPDWSIAEIVEDYSFASRKAKSFNLRDLEIELDFAPYGEDFTSTLLCLDKVLITKILIRVDVPYITGLSLF